jgi:serine/threonine protein kinase
MSKPGRYHIARKIADGGMAEIFVGTQHGMEGFERPVVLKRILAPLVADPQFRNMLIDEAHVAMGLNHSNIVQVLDLGHVRGRYFLVLELVEGWDLSQILARASAASFPVPPEILLYIAAEICRALAYAHARTRDGQPLAIVHRDVSPQNVLVSEQGEVKLTDFGIAKAMGRRERTNQGVIKGKLAFMSPEQASGAVLDNRSDLFALGTMLYLFFTGRRPFEAPTDLESIMRVRECRFTPAEMVRPALHPEVAKIIRRAMQAKPAHRYQSADEMLLDLENVQRTAYKPSGQTELKRWLAELQQRDHCPTISHAELPKPATPETAELDLGEGADVVFDESNVVDIEDVVAGIQPTIAASPESLSDIRPKIEAKNDAKTTAATPVAIGQNRIPARIIVFSLIVTALAIGAYLAMPSDSQRAGKRTAERAAERARTPERPKRAASAAEPKHEGKTAAVATVDPATAPGVTPQDGGPGSGSASVDAEVAHAPKVEQAPAPVVAESDEDEEKLLKNAEPEDSDRVIDENEGVRRKPAKPAAAARAAEPATPIPVRLVSTPEGAVISIGKRVFGRAPMNLRFRPGIAFDVTFVKKGYLPTTKRFTVSGRPNQAVRVTLKKKPAAKKSLLRRIFGR